MFIVVAQIEGCNVNRQTCTMNIFLCFSLETVLTLLCRKTANFEGSRNSNVSINNDIIMLWVDCYHNATII